MEAGEGKYQKAQHRATYANGCGGKKEEEEKKRYAQKTQIRKMSSLLRLQCGDSANRTNLVCVAVCGSGVQLTARKKWRIWYFGVWADARQKLGILACIHTHKYNTLGSIPCQRNLFVPNFSNFKKEINRKATGSMQ